MHGILAGSIMNAWLKHRKMYLLPIDGHSGPAAKAATEHSAVVAQNNQASVIPTVESKSWNGP